MRIDRISNMEHKVEIHKSIISVRDHKMGGREAVVLVSGGEVDAVWVLFNNSDSERLREVKIKRDNE